MTEPVTNEEMAPWIDIIKKMNGAPGTTINKTPLYILKAIIARLDAAEKERGALRQRVQQAEKAARITVETCRKQGIGLAKYLAYHHIGMLEKDLAEAEKERDELREGAAIRETREVTDDEAKNEIVQYYNDRPGATIHPDQVALDLNLSMEQVICCCATLAREGKLAPTADSANE